MTVDADPPARATRDAADRTEAVTGGRTGKATAPAFRKVRIWDIWVRLFHWSLVASIAVLVYSGRTGNLFVDWHRFAGEVVLALLVFRIGWGIIGSRNARLVALFSNPLDAIRDLGRLFFKRQVEPASGHDASGGWAVAAMLTLVGVQASTGLFIADEDEFVEGRFYGNVSAATSDWLHDVHQTNALLLQILVGIHIAMVLVYLLWARRNLIRAMITGFTAWPVAADEPSPGLQRPLIGLLLALLVAGTFGWMSGWYG